MQANGGTSVCLDSGTPAAERLHHCARWQVQPLHSCLTVDITEVAHDWLNCTSKLLESLDSGDPPQKRKRLVLQTDPGPGISIIIRASSKQTVYMVVHSGGPTPEDQHRTIMIQGTYTYVHIYVQGVIGMALADLIPDAFLHLQTATRYALDNQPCIRLVDQSINHSPAALDAHCWLQTGDNIHCAVRTEWNNGPLHRLRFRRDDTVACLAVTSNPMKDVAIGRFMEAVLQADWTSIRASCHLPHRQIGPHVLNIEMLPNV